MNNYRNNRKNRFKSIGDRNFRKRSSGGHKIQNDFNSNPEFRHRNPGRNNQNAAKLIDKYNNLAREALSSGDKTTHGICPKTSYFFFISLLFIFIFFSPFTLLYTTVVFLLFEFSQ